MRAMHLPIPSLLAPDQMTKGIIRFCYCKVIDAASTSAWEKHVFEDTYKEFFMQGQQFDQQKKYTTFGEMSEHLPRADQMHYLVSTAAVGYIRQLNEKIPDVVNMWGKVCVPFKNFRFEILQSHMKDRTQHKVAIYFYSEPLIWIATIENSLVVATNDRLEALNNGQEIETEMLANRPGLSISSFRKDNPPLAT
jgi:hypothetical protein